MTGIRGVRAKVALYKKFAIIISKKLWKFREKYCIVYKETARNTACTDIFWLICTDFFVLLVQNTEDVEILHIFIEKRDYL